MKKRNSIRPALALALTVLTPLPLLAAGSATIKNGDDVSRMSWQDPQTVRTDTATEDAYMVLRDGKTYLVSTQIDSGMPPVMEVGDMVQGLADALDEDGALTSPSARTPRIESVRKTGRTETVAGIQGDVYDVTLVDDQGETSHQSMVLTSDALATEMTAAYFAISGSIVGTERVAEFTDALPARQRGLLRLGDDIVVQAISSAAPAADTFELPAEPVNFGDLMKELMAPSQR